MKTTFKKDSYDTDGTVHLLSLPSQEIVYDSGNVRVAESDYYYDEYTAAGLSLMTRAGVTGLDSTYGSRTARGNATRVQRWRSDKNTFLETKQRFDVLGNVVESWDARGGAASPAYSTTLNYDDNFTSNTTLASGNAFAFVKTVTLPAPKDGVTGTYTITGKYDRYVGKLAEATDLNSVTSHYYYSDSLDRPSQFTRSSEQVTFSYPNYYTVSTSTLHNSFCSSSQNVMRSLFFYWLLLP